MAEWYNTRIRYRTLNREESKYKTVTEVFLHRAETFADVEFQVARELGKRLSEYKVKGIVEAKVSDIVLHHVFSMEEYHQPDDWYLCKVRFADFNESILITATSVVEANARLVEHLKLSQLQYTITGVDVTRILGVFDADTDLFAEDYRNRVACMPVQELRATKKVDKCADQIPVPFGDSGLTKAVDDFQNMLHEMKQEGATVSIKGPGDDDYRPLN